MLLLRRLNMRSAVWTSIVDRLNFFVALLQRGRNGTGRPYQPHCISSSLSFSLSLISSLLSTDPSHLRQRARQEQRHLLSAEHFGVIMNDSERHRLLTEEERTRATVARECTAVVMDANVMQELRKIHQYYLSASSSTSSSAAIAPAATGVSRERFHTFVSEIGMLSSFITDSAATAAAEVGPTSLTAHSQAHITLQQCDSLFDACLQPDDDGDEDDRTAATVAATMATGTTEAVQTLNLRRFLAALLRLAHIRYLSTYSSLPHRLSHFLRTHVLPRARRTVTEEFRMELKGDAVRAVVRQHRSRLLLIYARFTSAAHAHAQAHERKSSVGRRRSLDPSAAVEIEQLRMSLPQWLSLAAATGWVKKEATLPSAPTPPASATVQLSQQRLMKIFRNAHNDEDVAANNDSNGNNNTLSDASIRFPQFIEALTTVACFAQPDPFVTAAQKLELLLLQSLLPLLSLAV